MPKRHYATPIANFGSVSRQWSTSPARKEERFHHTPSMTGFTCGTASKNKCRDGACPVLDLLYRSEEHTPELQSRLQLVCRLLLEKKKAVGVVRETEVGGRDRLSP